MSNECARVQNQLSEYVDGALPADTAWRVQMHIAVCPDCTAVAHSLRATVDLMQGVSRLPTPGRFDAGLASKMAPYLPQASSQANAVGRLMRSLRIARARWYNQTRLVLAAAGATAAALVVTLAFVSSVVPGSKALVRPARPQIAVDIPAGDLAFVAACSSQHAQYQSAQTIADPTAEIVAARVDEAGASGNTNSQSQSDEISGSSDTE